MQNTKSINQEVLITETLQQITKIYEEIYLIKVKKTRDLVLRNRVFIDSLNAVFNDVKLVYGGFLLKNPKQLALRQTEHNQTAAVLLSSSKKFAGEVNRQVFQTFYNYVKQNDCDVLIIGKSGHDLFLEYGAVKNYRYFDTVDDPTLLPILHDFATVRLFYGKFFSLVRQVEANSVIREIDYSHLAKPGLATSAKSFLFEPSVETVAAFFEQELFDAFFRQSSKESILATLGSSISELEEATNNMDDRLLKLRLSRRHAQHRLANRRQLNILPSILFAAPDSW